MREAQEETYPLWRVTCQVRGHLSIPGGCRIHDEKEAERQQGHVISASRLWVLSPVPCGEMNVE